MLYNIYTNHKSEVYKLYKYREIYADIKRDILTNHYRAGTLLPTQEFFAEKYNVSRITLKNLSLY